MAKDQPFKQYEDRLHRVLAYIYDHLDQELDLDTLADIACLSRYHWHRVFKAMTGETLAEAIRRLRLTKAGNTLLMEETSVREIAARFGYHNLASFSRAFKKTHGVSPNEFRERGIAVTRYLTLNPSNENSYPVAVKEFQANKAAGVLHTGHYNKIGTAFKTLGGVLMAQSLIPKVKELFVIYHDHPDSKPSTELTSHVAVSILDDFPVHLEQLDYFTVAPGKYAVLEHTGPYAQLKTAYQWLYGVWLPHSGFELRDAPPLEVYISDPKTTPSDQLRTDIRLPIV